MTGLEAAQKFKIELNKLDTSSLIDVRLEKALHYLNKAALFLVKKKYIGKNPGPGRLEINHPVLDDLKVLIKEVNGLQLETVDEETSVEFKEDHLYFLGCQIKTSNATCTTPKYQNGRYVEPERVYNELQSPFNTSQLDDPMVTIIGNKLVVYHETFDVTDIKIKYLKIPNTITSAETIELPFVDEIIDVAITMALENFESQRIQTQPGINVASISE